MTPRQKTLVQETFAQVIPISEQAAALFYGRLFEIAPAVKPLFKGDMQEQGRKLMQIIGHCVAGLDQLDGLVPVVRELGRKHVGYGVTDGDYASVGSALLWTLEQGLGPAFTPDVKAAWAAVYQVLASTMRTAAKSVAA